MVHFPHKSLILHSISFLQICKSYFTCETSKFPLCSGSSWHHNLNAHRLICLPQGLDQQRNKNPVPQVLWLNHRSSSPMCVRILHTFFSCIISIVRYILVLRCLVLTFPPLIVTKEITDVLS
jgi:hypothetical protein